MKITYREYLTTIAICYEVALLQLLCKIIIVIYIVAEHMGLATAAGVGRLFGLDVRAKQCLIDCRLSCPMTPVMRAVEYPR